MTTIANRLRAEGRKTRSGGDLDTAYRQQNSQSHQAVGEDGSKPVIDGTLSIQRRIGDFVPSGGEPLLKLADKFSDGALVFKFIRSATETGRNVSKGDNSLGVRSRQVTVVTSQREM